MDPEREAIQLITLEIAREKKKEIAREEHFFSQIGFKNIFFIYTHTFLHISQFGRS